MTLARPMGFLPSSSLIHQMYEWSSPAFASSRGNSPHPTAFLSPMYSDGLIELFINISASLTVKSYVDLRIVIRASESRHQIDNLVELVFVHSQTAIENN